MDLEKIYDEQISPLMAQIIQIAHDNNMPYVAGFQLTDDDDDGGPLMCFSCLLPEDCSERLVQAKDILYEIQPGSGPSLMLTLRNEGER